MPLDPQAKTVLDAVAALGAPPMQTLPIEQIRAGMEQAPQAPGPEVGKVEDRKVPGPGGDVPVRIYTPQGSGPFPIMVWLHGGGFCLGSLRMGDSTCREIATLAGCIAIGVDYRLAPENKFPAGPEDCYAVVNWAAKKADMFDGDGSRIAVGGDSAGGNLSAVVAIMARDRGGPGLQHQFMVYPVLDYKPDTPSYHEPTEGMMLGTEMMDWFWDMYLKDQSEADNPMVSPNRATNLRGLPPALVMTAEYDVLRDEGKEYAAKLEDAGVPTTYVNAKGLFHGFFGMTAAIDKSKVYVQQYVDALKVAFKN